MPPIKTDDSADPGAANRASVPSSLARYMPRACATAEEMEGLRRRAWRQDGVLSLRDGDDRLTWPERELVRQIGERLYGSRAWRGLSSDSPSGLPASVKDPR